MKISDYFDYFKAMSRGLSQDDVWEYILQFDSDAEEDGGTLLEAPDQVGRRALNFGK